MTFADAVSYLGSLVNYERHRDAEAMRAMRLERMRALCERLGEPQRTFRSVLVTGTNGKGSTANLLYSMLREGRLRVGLYTSPHVEDLRERIRVWTGGPTAAERTPGDDWIANAVFADLLDQLRPILEVMRQDPQLGPPTYFEVLTAMALLHFAQSEVDVAVLEVGMGGRLDATNIVQQDLSILSPIDVDHSDVLGPDPIAIAQEKTGIIKTRQTVIVAPQSDAVMAVVRAACEAEGAALVRCGEDLTATIHQHGLDGLVVTLTGVRGIYQHLALPLLGRHQAQNASAAVGALELLSDRGLLEPQVQRGLELAEWPGRLEIVQDTPLVLLDGAHNAHAFSALRDALTELCGGRRLHLLVGLSSDKPVEPLGRLLGPLAASVTCTHSGHPRAADPAALAKRLAPFIAERHVIRDVADACTYVLNVAEADDVIVITGSLFLVGALRGALRRSHVTRRRLAAA